MARSLVLLEAKRQTAAEEVGGSLPFIVSLELEYNRTRVEGYKVCFVDRVTRHPEPDLCSMLVAIFHSQSGLVLFGTEGEDSHWR